MSITSSTPFGRTDKRFDRLRRCDGSRIAVVIPHIRKEPFRGTARYEPDDALGNVLRIMLEGPCSGCLHILLAEDQWQGTISSDSTYGCDYSLSLPPQGV